MKRFGALTKDEKNSAVLDIVNIIVDSVVNGVLDMELSNKESHKELKELLEATRKEETPTLAKEKILGNLNMRKELDKIALIVAYDSWYSDSGSLIMDLTLEGT